MTREAAIKHIELFKRCERLGGAIEDALDMAIAALREQESLAKKQATSDKTSDKTSEGCGWCKQFAGVPLRGFTEHGCQSITVKFCPMCGRRLEEV